MSEKLKEFLAADEKVLWEGHPTEFKMLDSVYKTKTLGTWIAVVLAAVIAAVAFFAGGLASDGDTTKIVLVLVILVFIPVFTIAISFVQKGKIEKSKYFITSKRAIIDNGDEKFIAMPIDNKTAYKIEKLDNGAEVLYIGTAAKLASTKSRHGALDGVNEENAEVTDGLVFYSIKNAEDVCMKYTSFYMK